METEKALISLGMSKQEAGVYLAAFRLGGASAAAIAKEAGMQRTAVYPILKTLAEKGLVNMYFKKSRQIFHAQNPNRLSEIFSNRLENFNRLIPTIETLDKKQARVFGLRFIETKEELKQFYLEILENYKNKGYRVIGNTQTWEQTDPKFFLWYRKERARRNIKTRLILSSDSRDFNPQDKSLLREYRYTPEEYKFKSTINIFEDKVLVISPDISSLAVVIAIPAMVDIFKSMFEIIWDSTQ